MIDAGTVLAGRFRVVRHVGSGGMASVFLAEDQVLGRNVAVKRIHAAPDTDLGRRIRREARIGANLRHPSLVTVFDVVADGEALLLVMEYVDGGTLADALRRGPLAPERAMAVLRPLADALDDLHAHGVVHRDVKPANVLLSERGAVKLSDLGVATSAEATQITQTGSLIGTAAYMAPEQFEPGPVTGAADVYALAVLAFEVLGGRRAFAGATPFEVIGRVHENHPPPDVREHRPDLPEAVSGALQRGMALRPQERTPSAKQLVDDLEAALGLGAPPAPALPVREAAEPTRSMPVVAAPVAAPAPAPPEPTRPPPPAPRSRRSRTPLLALAALLLVAGVALALALTSGGGDPQDERAAAEPEATTPRTQTATTPAKDPAPAAADPSTPAGAVRAFYERAADDDLEGSWALAGPRMRAQFGGSIETFRGTLGSLESIEFRELEVTSRDGDSATVTVRTVARHTNRTDRCSGPLRAVRGDDGGWLVEPAGISCG